MSAAAVTALIDLLDLLPSSFTVEVGGLEGLTKVNSSTFVVALAAGIAGMLALESRASAAVGVAISVTTVPASSYIGVAAGVGEVEKAAGALLVLGTNVVMLVAGARSRSRCRKRWRAAPRAGRELQSLLSATISSTSARPSGR